MACFHITGRLFKSAFLQMVNAHRLASLNDKHNAFLLHIEARLKYAWEAENARNEAGMS